MTPLAPDDPRHGTDNGYRNHGCRCDPCTRAHAVECEAWKLKVDLSPDDPRHGTHNGYNNYSCRCEPCRQAQAAALAARRRRKAAR